MNTAPDSPRISVIVCTYNHSRSLLETLDSLRAMTVPPELRWELIVVDNNSTDDTRARVQQFLSVSSVPGRYVFEGRQGLSAARNCGLAVATGELIAFTDDDVKVSADWLAEIHGEFERNASAAMIFGQTVPHRAGQAPLGVREGDKPEWFAHPAQPFNIGIGNNMTIRSTVAQQVGGFDVALGAGVRAGAGEDTDYIYRVLRLGHRILYSPRMRVRHDHDRMSEAAVRRIEVNYQRGRAAFFTKYVCRADLWALKLFYWDQVELWRGLFHGKHARRRVRPFIKASFGGCLLRIGQELRGLMGSGRKTTAIHPPAHTNAGSLPGASQ